MVVAWWLEGGYDGHTVIAWGLQGVARWLHGGCWLHDAFVVIYSTTMLQHHNTTTQPHCATIPSHHHKATTTPSHHHAITPS